MNHNVGGNRRITWVILEILCLLYFSLHPFFMSWSLHVARAYVAMTENSMIWKFIWFTKFLWLKVSSSLPLSEHVRLFFFRRTNTSFGRFAFISFMYSTFIAIFAVSVSCFFNQHTHLLLNHCSLKSRYVSILWTELAIHLHNFVDIGLMSAWIKIEKIKMKMKIKLKDRRIY